jgi:hypothetical protein
VGVKDTAKVFHSFRHGVQHALRRATPDEELQEAIQGRSNGKSVSRGYGAKEMLARWGVEALQEAVTKSFVSRVGLVTCQAIPGGQAYTWKQMNSHGPLSDQHHR